ncbi:MAG: hypothetical protein KDD53_03950 [Bdellovibrionales bacterium]|nr:hypothetical protein [Bdellovibrionales bacterium]
MQHLKLSTDLPFGGVILGQKDPSDFTLESFAASPDILYHGTERTFALDPRFDFHSSQYTGRDTSATLGPGIYTTTDRALAEQYSRIRGLPDGFAPIVLPLLPYRALMLDNRDPDRPGRNQPVPEKLLEAWKAHVNDNVARIEMQLLDSEIAPRVAQRIAHLYADELSAIKFGVDLRELLKVAQSGPWTFEFGKFMQANGYDGVICMEGGEDHFRNISDATHVFYSLARVGTYQLWKERSNAWEGFGA